MILVFFFHPNNGYAKSHLHYDIPTFPVLFVLLSDIWITEMLCSALLLFRCEYANVLFLVYTHIPGINSDYINQRPYVHTVGKKIVDTLDVMTTHHLKSLKLSRRQNSMKFSWARGLVTPKLTTSCFGVTKPQGQPEVGEEVSARNVGKLSYLDAAVYPRKFH